MDKYISRIQKAIYAILFAMILVVVVYSVLCIGVANYTRSLIVLCNNPSVSYEQVSQHFVSKQVYDTLQNSLDDFQTERYSPITIVFPGYALIRVNEEFTNSQPLLIRIKLDRGLKIDLLQWQQIYERWYSMFNYTY